VQQYNVIQTSIPIDFWHDSIPGPLVFWPSNIRNVVFAFSEMFPLVVRHQLLALIWRAHWTDADEMADDETLLWVH